MKAQLKPADLHDLALQSGAFMDRADPEQGFHHDSYVFTREELERFAEMVMFGKERLH